jgi:hypothetical protein
MKNVVAIKSNALVIEKMNASRGCILPDGISLLEFRGFRLSINRSVTLLKLTAALRAKIIHRITLTNTDQLNVWSVRYIERKKPIIAKGSAKIVWLNFTNDR